MSKLMTGVALLAFLGASPAAHAADVSLLDDFWGRAAVNDDVRGDLLRMDVDVTGDGQPELFLANSQMTGKSDAQEWFIYQVAAATGRSTSLGRLTFPYRMFRVSASPVRLVVFGPRDYDLGSVETYLVDGTGLHLESSEDNVPYGAREQEFADWRTASGLKVLAADLRQFDGIQVATWRDVLKNAPASGVSNLEGLVLTR